MTDTATAAPADEAPAPYDLTLTLAGIRKHGPCEGGWRKLLAHLGKTRADDDPLTIVTVYASNGFDDALWCLRAMPDDRLSRHFQAWCAEQVLPIFEAERPDDARVRYQIAMLRNDVATREERAAAWAAAWDAARAAAWAAASDAARDAARAAAWAAAWDAARAAAWAAASDAARDAARAAASDAARDAAWAAAWDAARDAASDAARDAAWAAAWDAARAAAWAAASDAARDAARAAAWDAARAAAWAAASDAARDAAWAAAWAAAWDAARDAQERQFRRMIGLDQ